MKMFLKCMRESLSSPLTYIAIILFAALCCFCGTVHIGDFTYTVFETMFSKKLQSGLYENTGNSSYLQLINVASLSSWYIIGFPVLTAAPALFSYKNRWEHIEKFTLIRKNYRSFSMSIVISAFITGAVVTLLGTALYGVVLYSFFPSLGSFGEGTLMTLLGGTVERVFRFVRSISEHAVVGGLLSVLTLTLYRYIRSDFLAITIPMMIMYLSVKLLPNYREWLYSDPIRGENKALILLCGLFPSNLIGLGGTFEGIGITVWAAYIFFALLLTGLYFLFYRSVKHV